MKIRAAKKQALLKTVSFVLAMTIMLNIISMSAFSAVSAESAYTPYSGGDEILSDIFSELPDSAELEEMYIDELFYGEDVSFFKDYGANVLDGARLEIYEFLRNEIEKVAAGESTETVFTFEPSSPYNDPNVFGGDLTAAIRYLTADLPQAFYWYDKTNGCGMKLGGYTDGSVNYYDKCILSFAVSENYADKSAGMTDGRYLTVNPAKINSAKKAVENARRIADEYRDMSDYNKIIAYKNRICNLAEYDHAAADNADTPYGDPWQLVYVFDDDPDTNVVCEGYSKAFQYLCDLGGIECYTVTGELSGGTGAGGHMWNIVVLDGKSYLVDITNCDGDSVGYPDKLLLKGAARSDSKGCVFYLDDMVSYTYDEKALSLYTEEILTVAAEDYVQDTKDPDAKHNHSVCAGAEGCPDDIHGGHEAKDWTEWSSTDSLPDLPGYYYLSADVTLTAGWTPPVGETSICLNGNSITADPDAINSASPLDCGLICINGKDITLNICDCEGEGAICGSTSTHGGGVYNKGAFNLYGGKISKNTALYSGGGVLNGGTFCMYGGEISENNSADGGGVLNDFSGVFTMLGGKIIGNTAEGHGAGVGAAFGDPDTSSDRITLGGSAVIKDNFRNDISDNLYIQSNAGSADVYQTLKLDTSKPLAENAYIGVTTETKPTADSSVNITGENDEDYSRFFHSDSSDCKIVNGENNVIQLVISEAKAFHKHTVCEGAENCPENIHDGHAEIEWIAWESTVGLPSGKGNYYLTCDVTLTSSWMPPDGERVFA